MDISFTVKVKIYPSEGQKRVLLQTMRMYQLACNYLSQTMYENPGIFQSRLHRLTYDNLRTRYKLKSQMAISAIRFVHQEYKRHKITNLSVTLLKFSRNHYDLVMKRDYSINRNWISINTINDRVILPYSELSLAAYLKEDWRFGQAKLVHEWNRWYLYIRVIRKKEKPLSEYKNFISLTHSCKSIISAITTEKGIKSFIDPSIEERMKKYALIKMRLMKQQTLKSLRLRSKIRNHELRWMTHINDEIVGAILEHFESDSLFFVEDQKIGPDLCNCDWSYEELIDRLSIKAQEENSLLIKLGNSEISSRCPKCTYINKLENFTETNHCTNCGQETCGIEAKLINLMHYGEELVAKKRLL